MSALSFYNLPRTARELVLKYVFHAGGPSEAQLHDRHPPYHPKASLLYVSSRIHDETILIFYSSIGLGGDAAQALSYLRFVNPDRLRRYTRTLTVDYQCLYECRSRYTDSTDWLPAFHYLWDHWTCLRRINIRFQPCLDCGTEDNTYLEKKCELMWNEEADVSWRGLKRLTTPEEIVFNDEVPEYFAYTHAKELGWRMEGTVSGGIHDGIEPLTRFRGRLINPQYPDIYSWHLHIHSLIDSGIDVRMLIYDKNDASWKNTAVSTTRTMNKESN
ncbi:hypothetical protein VTK26DRAFT_312 [Humicola hyalothermophila]